MKKAKKLVLHRETLKTISGVEIAGGHHTDESICLCPHGSTETCITIVRADCVMGVL